MACKVVVHDTAGTRDISFTVVWEEPTSTAELRLSIGQSTGTHQTHAGPTEPRRARKAPAALLQHGGRAGVPTLAEPSAKRNDLAHPSPSGPVRAHLRPGAPRSGGRRRPPVPHGAPPRAPLRSAATPLFPGRAGPESSEEHRRDGSVGPRTSFPQRGGRQAAASGVARASPGDLCRRRRRREGVEGEGRRPRLGEAPSPSGGREGERVFREVGLLPWYT
jgi:hypothetical protein